MKKFYKYLLFAVALGLLIFGIARVATSARAANDVIPQLWAKVGGFTRPFSFTRDILRVSNLASSTPISANGAIYYNTLTNKFRCYENSAWTNCIGAGGGSSAPTTTIQGLTPSDGVFTLATSSDTGINLNITTTTPRTITFAPQLQTGYGIPLTASTTQWSGFYNNVLSRLAIATGTTGTIFNVSTTTNSITINLPTASASNTGQLSATDWSTFNGKQAALSGGTIGQTVIWTSASAIGVGKLIDNGTVIGMNATSSTIGFNIQGTSGTNDIFNAASSSGTSILKITALSRVGIGSATPTSLLTLQGTSGSSDDLLRVASSSGTSLFSITPTTTGTTLLVVGSRTNNIFQLASSTNTIVFQVDGNGNVMSGGVAPTTNSGTISANSTNTRGRTIPAVAATTATITFAEGGFGTTPFCTVTQESGTAIVFTASATPTTLVLTGTTIGSDSFAYQCWK